MNRMLEDSIKERDAEIARLRAENEEWRERCLGVGANRYWEGRWRDEAKENVRLRALNLRQEKEIALLPGVDGGIRRTMTKRYPYGWKTP